MWAVGGSAVLLQYTVVLFCCRLMLMALYNVSISVKGLKGISENPGLLPLIWTLLDGKETFFLETHQSHSEQLNCGTNCKTHSYNKTHLCYYVT